MEQVKNRKPGTWGAGTSGNPGGRPRGIEAKLRERFGDDAITLIGVLVQLGRGEVPEGYGGETEIKTSDRIRACEIVLDRILGKPTQAIEGAVDVSLSPTQIAVMEALKLTPHERRQQRIAIEADVDADED